MRTNGGAEGVVTKIATTEKDHMHPPKVNNISISLLLVFPASSKVPLLDAVSLFTLNKFSFECNCRCSFCAKKRAQRARKLFTTPPF